MSGMIANLERDTYEEMWGVEQYANHSPAERVVQVFDSLVRERGWNPRDETVLDAGCGSGKGAIALAALKYHMTGCDLTDVGLVPEAKVFPFFVANLWEPLNGRYVQGGAYDWVFCCDVMEHVPTFYGGLAITQMLKRARKGLFLSVSFTEDAFGLWVGRPLHLTIQSFPWWRDNLNELGKVVEARDMISNGVFLVEPR
jgi:2-polyprenyl-3-methyl-5-hydroxy-6-metoxy-1,4-benzoquinol methylase